MSERAAIHENPESTTAANQAPFRRMLVVIDGSVSAHAATDLAAQWVEQHGAEVRFVQLAEGPKQRNRQLVQGIADSASAFGADVIVLGIERRRLVRHRLAASLRELVTRATELPVLVPPAPSARRPAFEASKEGRVHPSTRRYAHV